MPETFHPTDGTLTLEVAWGQTSEVEDADLVWTDESSYLITADTSSGRSDAYELVPPGRAVFVLVNTTGRFDPLNTGGALYSDLNGKIGHPVRLRATRSATTYDLWRGFVEAVQQGVERSYAGKYATAVLVCTDALGDLSVATLPDSAWSVEVLRGVRFETDGSAVPDPPIHWWRMGESSGTVCRDSTPLASPGPANGTYVGTTAPVFNYRVGLCKASPDGAIEFDGTDMHVTLPSATWTPPFTVVARIVPTVVGQVNPIIKIDGGGSASFSFGLDASNYLTATFHDGTDTRTSTSTGTALTANTVNTVACVVLPDAAPKLSLQGNTETVSSSGSGTLGAITGTGYIARSGSDYFSGIIDEVVVYDFDAMALDSYAPPAHRIADYHDVAEDAWDDDTFELRTKKILDAAFWPSDLRDVATTSTWLYDPAEFTGATALAYLNEIARSEDGLIYADPTGKVVCEDRRSRYTNARSTASQATLTDDPAGTYRYETLIRDGQSQAWVRNRIVARRKFGSDLVAQDTAYKRGQAEDLGTLMLQSEADVQSLLDRRLTARKTPQDRFTQVGWTPRRSGAHWALLARKISDRVTVVHTPPGGVQLTRTCWIEGVEHRINARTTTWSVVWRLSPTITDPD